MVTPEITCEGRGVQDGRAMPFEKPDARPGRQLSVLLINAFEKLPGENFRDQRYTFLYETLKRRSNVDWLSSDFHHWSHSRREVETIPVEDRAHIHMVRTLSYRSNVSVRRFIAYVALSIATLWYLGGLKQKPDVIVCMGPTEQMFLVALYGRMRRVPVVIDVIDTWPDVYAQAFPRALRWLGRLLLAPYFLMSFVTFKLCTRVTAVSHTYLNWAMRRGRRDDRESFACYYLGARNDHFDVKEVPTSKGFVTCLFAGQFGFSYDVELILDAAERLQSAGRTDIRFVLCGAGAKQAVVAQRVGALRNVELFGWVTPIELNSLAMRCQVGLCCYTSFATQSVPTKVFDYLSMGLYVISSLAGEAQDLLSGHAIGTTYRADDLDDFLQCLERVRCERDLGPSGRAEIRAIFERYFDAPAIYENMVDEVVFPLAYGAAPYLDD